MAVSGPSSASVGPSLRPIFTNKRLVFVPYSSPFDVEDFTLSSGNVSKATVLQRRVSVYSQGTPETPTFHDASFFVSPMHRPRASLRHISGGIPDFVAGHRGRE